MHFDLWVREIENCRWVERLYSRVVFPPETKGVLFCLGWKNHPGLKL
jgi:hypothetical protein